ncbi:MAG: zf-HC2 domain-containing protein [Firmicutes bacterium]|nr:zf-HC2 domain-containing protein [Bacillota bacterium]
MKCSEIRELLSLYIDNMLESSLREEVSAHIDTCPSCRNEYEELVSVVKMLSELPEVTISSDFDRRLREALDAETDAEKAKDEYETVRIARKKKIKKISSLCAIFVVGIFALAMYNNIDRLIPGNDADEMMLSSEYECSQNTYGILNDVCDYSSANGVTKKSTVEDTVEDTGEVPEYRYNAAEYGAAANEIAPVNETAAGAEPSAGHENEALTDEQSQYMDDVLPMSADETNPAAVSAEGENPVSRGADSVPPLYVPVKGFSVTQGAISDARDSVAIRYYMRALEKALEDTSFEILMCESKGDGIWSFEIDLVSTDESGNEIHEYVTYYGQDGTLWRETGTEE